MRDTDRFWWLLLPATLAFIAGGVGILYFNIVIMLSPDNNPNMTSGVYWLLIILLCLASLGCFVTGGWLVVTGLRARKRHHTRLETFLGEMYSMPISAISLGLPSAPDMAATPLTLMWRVGRVARVLYLLRFGFLFLVSLIYLASTLVKIAALIFPPMSIPASEYAPQPLNDVDIISITIVVVVGITFVWLKPHIFGRPFGITASSAGIDVITELGHRTHMIWDEVRLWEVAAGDRQAQRRFSLYAAGKRITWAEFRSGLYEPVGMTFSEVALRQALLLHLVAAQTGLAPRTLSRSLA